MNINKDLEKINDKVNQTLRIKSEARDTALHFSRQSIRYCANAIRSIHRNDFEQGKTLISQSKSLLEQIKTVLENHPDIFYNSSVHDAQKEYAEASITLALVTDNPLPDPDSLGIEYSAFLNGLGEAAGELRRQLLDRIRDGNFQRCDYLLQTMDDIYGLLVTVDFPDALTGGLRRTTDNVRGILEKSRGDLTMAVTQAKLEKRLDQLNKVL